MGRGEMVVQSMVFPNQVCAEVGLYFRTEGEVYFEKERIYLLPHAKIDTNTYMNLFDADAWEEYTGIKSWKICFQIKGVGKVSLKEGEHTIAALDIQSSQMIEKQMPFTYRKDGGQFFLEVESEDGVDLSAIHILAVGNREAMPVRMAMNICTYHRQKSLQRILDVIANSAFFQKNHALYGKLLIYVVDNASEIERKPQEFVSVFHNPNTGGSGGFTRGLVEIRKTLSKTGVTHVIFMDDDVELISETLYRIYALLSLMKESYQNEVIAGRMFRTDDRKIQYTAAEIWNKGDIRHIGFNVDMTLSTALGNVNNNTGAEYGGWWLCCFPMAFVKDNDPLPFFLHCDDVEYGLRHGGTPIILNGIQVWHETYEYRQSAVMAYYDYRNSLIVNSLYGFEETDKEKQWQDFLQRINDIHDKGEYLLEYCIIRAFCDYRKGMRWFMKKNNAVIHGSLTKKKRAYRWTNVIRMKLAFLKEKGEMQFS